MQAFGLNFGGVQVMREAIHEGAAGKRYLVLHGDEFDGVVRYAKWLALLGDWAYNMALRLNHWFNLARRALGLPYWSLSAWLKHKVKNAVEYIGNYEKAVADEARRRGVDGVICGHIHHAEIRDFDGVLYCNDGDWVESCTGLVEHHDGRPARLPLPGPAMHYSQRVRRVDRLDPAVARGVGGADCLPFDPRFGGARRVGQCLVSAGPFGGRGGG